MKLITDGNPKNTEILQDNGDKLPGVVAVSFSLQAGHDISVSLQLELFDLTGDVDLSDKSVVCSLDKHVVGLQVEQFDLMADIDLSDKSVAYSLGEKTRDSLKKLPPEALQSITEEIDSIIFEMMG